MANEKRLIDAEAIARKLKNQHCAECHIVRAIQCSACWVNDVLELLEGDAVDAVEVVHADWKDCENADFVYCTHCKKEWNVFDNRAELFYYCPNCGAKMDGVRREA